MAFCDRGLPDGAWERVHILGKDWSCTGVGAGNKIGVFVYFP